MGREIGVRSVEHSLRASNPSQSMSSLAPKEIKEILRSAKLSLSFRDFHAFSSTYQQQKERETEKAKEYVERMAFSKSRDTSICMPHINVAHCILTFCFSWHYPSFSSSLLRNPRYMETALQIFNLNCSA